ncbi:hypothetical protein H4R27_000671 [Coemansia aciculifera]|nr:hypothetical protein H4R27_000671 [Coemansia aciculifera]
MVSELNILIIVSIAVTALSVGILLCARRFRGQRNEQIALATRTARQTRIAQFRPSDRPVKPYNAFSEDELQLIEAIALTDDDIKAINAPKAESGNKTNQVNHASLRFASPECSICLAPFESADVVRVLVCGHTYHTECIDVWLTQRSARCPICKTDIRDALGLESRSRTRRCSTEAGAQSPLSDTAGLTSVQDNSLHHTIIHVTPPPPALLPQT